MPLHLDSITSKESSGILAWILQHQLNLCEDAFATKDKLCAHCSKNIFNEVSGEKIGEYIFTIKTNIEKQANEILDIDIVLKNSNRIEDYRTKAMYLVRKGEFKEALDTIAVAFGMKKKSENIIKNPTEEVSVG